MPAVFVIASTTPVAGSGAEVPDDTTVVVVVVVEVTVVSDSSAPSSLLPQADSNKTNPTGKTTSRHGEGVVARTIPLPGTHLCSQHSNCP